MIFPANGNKQTKNWVSNAHIRQRDFKTLVSNLWPVSCLWPRMAMNAAQHKIINLLKTLWDFLCVITCHMSFVMSCKINVRILSLFICMHGFSFPVVCGFQCGIFQAQAVELTPSDVTCARGDLARQRLSVIFQPCNGRHLMLLGSQVGILIWLLNILRQLSSASHIVCHTLQSALCLTLHQQLRGLWKCPNVAFYFPVNYVS